MFTSSERPRRCEDWFPRFIQEMIFLLQHVLWLYRASVKQDRIWPALCQIGHCDCSGTGSKFFGNHSGGLLQEAPGRARARVCP
jgi:hypothetical protein